MATAWVKSLQCKSRAVDVHNPIPKNILPTSSSCRGTVQSIKDVIDTTTKQNHRKPKSPFPKQPGSVRPRPAEPSSDRARFSSSALPTRTSDQYFPALKELGNGHPSRNVVEIIFHTSWSPKAFLGQIEMIFKIQNAPRTVARFEEYREAVKARAGSGQRIGKDASAWEDNARCVADGNEVMRFHCLGPASGGAYVAGATLAFSSGKGSSICTFSGSGEAHEKAGGGRGRRAMVVCRVVAGRVCKQLGIDSWLEERVGFDSVSGDNGELLVFDPRAVLPCFLIIYKL
ncbi:uncharacterized protein LOC131164859 isoform X2 [Malania oleifera]|uniref:uncharacterized protein LOC131164859 isoform X2 n=1 Tax=Malania oleifera TaxID=397392 RepID=UPI0025AE5DAA|nr:uncharacterized protein LOC131164859 isoform X2 [Malania oleifera]